MSMDGIEVYIPVRLVADRDHEWMVADMLRRHYAPKPVYVEYVRTQNVLALNNHVPCETIASVAYATLEVPY